MAFQVVIPLASARLSWMRRPSPVPVITPFGVHIPRTPVIPRPPSSFTRIARITRESRRIATLVRVVSSEGGSGSGDGRFMELLPVGDGTSFHLQNLGQPSAGHAPAIRLPAGEDARVVLGRKGGGKADLEIDVASLSASHAALTISRGRLFVTDLGSTNGTRVNGRYLGRGEETRLRDGQVVILGDEHLAAFEVAGAGGGGGGGVLGAFSGLLPSNRKAEASTARPAPTVANSTSGNVDNDGEKRRDGASDEALAGKVAGAVVRGMPGEMGRQAGKAVTAATQSQWATAVDSTAKQREQLTREDDEEDDNYPEGGLIATPSTSSVEVVPPEGGGRLTTASSGEVAERAGPFGALAGLAEATGRLGASINNSQVQVNYQYRPVVQFNTGGKALGPGELKSALLVAIAGKARGLKATERDVQKIEQLARSLEAANPTRAPLRSPLLNGRWALQYTTCKGTLGGSGFLAPSGPIHQTVDIFNQKVLNESTFEPLPFLKWTNASSGSLNAKSESRAAVKPEQFRVGPFKMKSPPKSPGRAAMEWEAQAMGASSEAWLDTSYLDADTRISRNSNGELFVFTRDDPNDD